MWIDFSRSNICHRRRHDYQWLPGYHPDPEIRGGGGDLKQIIILV